MGFRVFSNEQTALAYDGTPEVKVAGRDGKPETHPDAPVRGLPEGHPAGLRSVLKPGMNEISDNEYALLARDVNFQRHIKEGYLAFVGDDGNAIEPPTPPEYVAEPVHNPAARFVVNQGAETLPAERTDAYAEQTGDRRNEVTGEGAALKTGEPVVQADNAVEQYFKLTPEEREAMYPALSAEEKVAVDADARSAPVNPAPKPSAVPGRGTK